MSGGNNNADSLNQQNEILEDFFDKCSTACQSLHSRLQSCQSNPLTIAAPAQCACANDTQGLVNSCIQCVVDQGGPDEFDVKPEDFSSWVQSGFCGSIHNF